MRPRTWPSAMGLVLLALAGCGGASPERGSAVLITLDTTRADAVGPSGVDGAARTPVLDELARRGIVFERASTVSPLTLPAHTSMLTGLYPPRHGIRNNGFATLPRGARSLAERARAAGYSTAAFVSAAVLSPEFGLDRGFEIYDAPNKVVGETTFITERPGAEVVSRAIEWIRDRGNDEPFFLWVHLFEPHAPYEPPAEFLAAHGDRAYHAEIAAADRLLEPLIASLDELEEAPTVLFVADHGEGLGEHGEETHGCFVYQTTLAVPMILVRGDGARAGERSSAVVSVVDIAPTLQRALGLDPIAGLDGLTLYEENPEATRGVYFESYAGYLDYGWSPLAGWLDRSGKYIHSSSPELYDLEQDPDEENNLYTDKRQVSTYHARIDALFNLPAYRSEDDSVIDESLLGQIQALGYAGSGPSLEALPHPLEPSEGPSPHASLDEFHRIDTAFDHYNRGNREEALRAFDEVLRDNPRSFRALSMKVECMLQLGQMREAIEPLQQLLQSRPPTPTRLYNLGVCLKEAGRIDEAIRNIELALEMSTEKPAWFRSFLKLLLENGRQEAATKWVRRFGTEPTPEGG